MASILILLSRGAPLDFRFDRAAVVENDDVAVLLVSAVAAAAVAVAGRDDIDKGILKTLARDARTGESGRIVSILILTCSRKKRNGKKERSPS